MGTLILSATAVLVVLGFSNEVLWLAAVALLYLYVRYGRTGGGSSTAPSSGSPASGGSAQPASYRDRRDRQAKWERRYRRERPFETRRQERQKGNK